MINKDKVNDNLRRVVDTFWDTIPAFWQRVRAHIRQVAAEEFDISVEQFHTLRGIRNGHCSVSELAQIKNISRPAISQAVDILVNKGLIVRIPDASDRRYLRLALTEAGNSLLNTIFENTSQWMQQMFSSLSEAELQQLTQAMLLLRKI